MINIIISIRKNTNKKLGFMWIFLGRNIRKFLSRSNLIKYTSKKIGSYGPFKMVPEFLFSNLEEWGGGHNNGFHKYVESSKNMQCILDIGAHAGFTVLPVSSSISMTAKLFAFEPSTKNYNALKTNINLNGIDNVVIENCLVGDEAAAEAVFYETNDICSTSSIVSGRKNLFYKTLKKQVSIDSYCIENKLKPDLIKIDVEGAELSVLKGARQIISSCKPIIYLSVHPNEIQSLGYDVNILLDEIKKNNYQISNIDGSEVDHFSCVEYIVTPE